MKNTPQIIYLQVDPDDLTEKELNQVDFSDLNEVTWCETKQYDNDIEYTLRWFGPDVVPQENSKVVDEFGVTWCYSDRMWFRKDGATWKLDERKPNKWRYPEPKVLYKHPEDEIKWHKNDEFPPCEGYKESCIVINQSGERVMYDFLDQNWYSADNPSREAEVTKWRFFIS